MTDFVPAEKFYLIQEILPRVSKFTKGSKRP